MGAMGFIRLGVWQNFMRAWRSGYQGNMNGEGFILGGVFVIGPGEQVASLRDTSGPWHAASAKLYFNFLLCLQGILMEHREKEFGNKVDTANILEAVKKIVPEK